MSRALNFFQFCELVGKLRRDRLRNLPIDDLGREDANDDGELVNGHQQTTAVGGCDFGDIHRGDVRGQDRY